MATQAPPQTDTLAPNERRERARKEIKQLIENRNTVLGQYYSLIEQIEDMDNPDHTQESLQEFCQELVDYLAIGHFELYRRIEEGNERRDEIIKLAQKIMPVISTTTQVAVAFNDRYDHNTQFDKALIKQLPAQLTQLGEHLATRIDLEDKLINTLLNSSNSNQANLQAASL